MTGEPKLAEVTLQEYLEIERADNQRYEFYHGRLYAMAGGTFVHSVLCANAHGVLRDVARAAGTCAAFTSEMKVEVQAKGKYVYPDAGLGCPKLEESKHLTGAIVNPKLIVEVTSESSLVYDTTKKLKEYFTIPTLHEYVLIYQHEPSVIIYRKRNDLFKIDHYMDLTDVIKLESVAGEIKMADIYENVAFPENLKKESK